MLWDSLGGRLHRRILVPPSGVSSVPPAAGCIAGFKQLRTLVDVLPLWVAPLVRLLLLDLFIMSVSDNVTLRDTLFYC